MDICTLQGRGEKAGQLITFCLFLPPERFYLGLDESLFDIQLPDNELLWFQIHFCQGEIEQRVLPVQ
eukprot:892221-Ditylum_brightwellii.AAC.1